MFSAWWIVLLKSNDQKCLVNSYENWAYFYRPWVIPPNAGTLFCPILEYAGNPVGYAGTLLNKSSSRQSLQGYVTEDYPTWAPWWKYDLHVHEPNCKVIGSCKNPAIMETRDYYRKNMNLRARGW